MPQRTMTHEAFLVNLFSSPSLGLPIILLGWTYFEGIALVAICALGTAVSYAPLWTFRQIRRGRLIVCDLIISHEAMWRSRVPSAYATNVSFTVFSGAVVYNFDAVARSPVRATLAFGALSAILWLVNRGTFLLASRRHEPLMLWQLQEAMGRGDVDESAFNER